jgi:hypothetical protein
MPTPIEDFVAHPRTFLQNNVLRVLFQLAPTPGHIRQFKFEAKPYTATRLSDNTQVPCYSLMPVLGQERTILLRNAPSANRDFLDAYWCPYDDDAMHSIVVDGAANFMFTSNMDGCSFGVGSQTPTGARRVAHVNLRSQGPSSHAAQRGTLTVGGLDRHMVDPDAYMSSPLQPTAIYGEIKATTIGIRNRATGHWSFYYQHYRLIGGQINQVVLLGFHGA